MTINNNKLGRSLLEWDLRFCWLLRSRKLCTEDIEKIFYKSWVKAKKRESWVKIWVFLHLALFCWERGIWDCLNWSHNKLSSNDGGHDKWVHELFPDIVLVQDKVLFTQVPASPPPLLFDRWWVCPVGQVVQVIPASFVETQYMTGWQWKYEWWGKLMENVSDQSGEFGQSTL